MVVQTRKFFIKVLVCNAYVLNVCTPEVQDLDYNLKRDGWLNYFVDAKNHLMKEDGIPWRSAREMPRVL